MASTTYCQDSLLINTTLFLRPGPIISPSFLLQIIPQNDYPMIGIIKNIDTPESNLSNPLSSIISNDESSVRKISPENVVVQSSSFPITSTNQLQSIKPISKYLTFISMNFFITTMRHISLFELQMI